MVVIFQTETENISFLSSKHDSVIRAQMNGIDVTVYLNSILQNKFFGLIDLDFLIFGGDDIGSLSGHNKVFTGISCFGYWLVENIVKNHQISLLIDRNDLEIIIIGMPLNFPYTELVLSVRMAFLHGLGIVYFDVRVDKAKSNKRSVDWKGNVIGKELVNFDWVQKFIGFKVDHS